MKTTSSLLKISLRLFFIFGFLIPFNTYGQERGVFELETKKNEVSAKNNSKRLDTKNDRKQFYNLAFKLHPTIYLDNNSKNTVNRPLKLHASNLQYLSKIKQLEINKSIELITITVTSENELNSKLDFSILNKLKSLKYVYIKLMFNCNIESIKKFIGKNLNSKIRVFYKNEIPS